MSRLSLQAQAVLAAFDDRYELCGPFDDWQELCLAAALRTAVNEMSREWGYYKHHDFLRDIAAELEGSNG